MEQPNYRLNQHLLVEIVSWPWLYTLHVTSDFFQPCDTLLCFCLYLSFPCSCFEGKCLKSKWSLLLSLVCVPVLFCYQSSFVGWRFGGEMWFSPKRTWEQTSAWKTLWLGKITSHQEQLYDHFVTFTVLQSLHGSCAGLAITDHISMTSRYSMQTARVRCSGRGAPLRSPLVSVHWPQV